MSSILKALEKAEQSNSTRRGGVDSGLLRTRNSRPSWVLPAAVLAGGAVAALLTYAAMGGFSRPAPLARASAPIARTAPVVVAPLHPSSEAPAGQVQAAPLDPAANPQQSPAWTATIPGAASSPDAAAGQPQASPGAAPATPQQEAANPAALLIPKSAPARKVAALPKTLPLSALPGKASRSAAVARPQPAAAIAAPAQAAPAPVKAAEPAAAESAAPPPAPAAPALKVTGIAWQNKGESSFAVVNGRAVLQGATVDGYKVLEIHHDMVRFSGKQGTIDVPLGEGE